MNGNRQQSLADKVVVITGASRGLGRSLAVAAGRAGAKLVLVSRQQSAENLRSVRDEVAALGAEVLTITADVAARDDVERLAAETLARFGRVDVLVNNASALGPTPMPLLLDTSVDAFEEVQRTNVTGPFLLIRTLAGSMLARNAGLIVNVSSDAGAVGYPHWGAYGVSKAALDHLTRVWAAELEGTGVGIVSVDPGSMNTLMHRLAEPHEDPGQWPEPEAVAPVFVALMAVDPTRLNGRRYEAQQDGLQAELSGLATAVAS